MNSWLTLIPPFVTILLAFITRQVHLSLFMGLFSGIIILHSTDFIAYTDILDKYLLNSIADKDHVYIILFSLFISGTITLIKSYNGLSSIIAPFTKKIKTQKQALTATYLSGLILFFDDYANSLVIGNTMRPITDQYKISRAKLAYIVDSTSAPISSIALVSTWVGAEISYINESIINIDTNYNGYSLFLKSIPYAYYPILTLLFIPIIIQLNYDYGPMSYSKIEKQSPPDTKKQHLSFWKGFTPILVLIVSMIAILISTGYTKITDSISAIFGNSNSYKALLWSSFLSLLTASLIALSLNKKTPKKILDTIFEGFNHLLPTIAILILAWALSAIISDLKTSEYLIQLFPKNSPIFLLPFLVFILSGITSFATGSSWGTMAIIFPLVIPLAFASTAESSIIYASIASVLSGSVFGDHCSPISDTTILSSMASGCDHIEHVKTQIPYALTVGITSCLILLFPISPIIGIPIGAIVLYLFIFFLSKRKK